MSARDTILNAIGDTLDELHITSVTLATDAIIAALSAQGYQIIKFVKRQRPPIVFESDDDDPAATPPGEA